MLLVAVGCLCLQKLAAWESGKGLNRALLLTIFVILSRVYLDFPEPLSSMIEWE